MKSALPSSAGVVTGGDVFRVASPCLYLAMLAHALLGMPAATLAAIIRPGTAIHAAPALGIVPLLLLTALALARYRRPVTQPPASITMLAEFGFVTAVTVILTLQRTVPAMPLPWLIGMAGVFPMALPRGAATLAIAIALAAGCALNLATGVPLAVWLPGEVAVLFAGLLAMLLAAALRMNHDALHQARTQDRRFNAIARATRHVFMITDGDFSVKYVNPAIHDVLGFTPEEVESSRISPVVHPEDSDRHQEKLRFLRQRSGSRIFSRHRTRHRDGHWVWLETRGYNMLHDEAIGGLVFSIEDISARMDAERKLEQEHGLLRAVLDLNPSMIYAKDAEGRFTVSNASFQRRFGYANEEELRGKTTHEVFQSQSVQGNDLDSYRVADEFHRRDMQVIESGEPLEDLEIQGFWGNDSRRWYRTNIYPLQDAQGTRTGVLGITSDITERKQYEMRLEHQALHDPLTGLPNRRYLLARIADAIAATDAVHPRLAMLFCDLDFFKSVNDTHGHETGDQCLLEITRRLGDAVPAGQFISRFGGDEFVILADGTLSEAHAIAGQVLLALSQPIEIGEVTVKIHASIGVAQLTTEHKSPSDLLRDADAAMYQAKERGRNRSELFDASMQISTTRRARMDVALRFALERSELELAYQPKISLADGALEGFELLLRWNSPQYGYIPPDEFIPIAEHSGQVVPIGLWALQQACMQLSEWTLAYPHARNMVLAVNVSVRQLVQPSFVDDVAAALAFTGIPAHAIELELTETSAMANPRQTIETLSRLKSLGVRLALDDFGTGYSSLAYLQRLPLDVLKIDKAFVMGLGRNRSDDEIVRLILALARTLALDTVAEGVETEHQAEELRRLGCRLAQGFLYAPALSAADAQALLAGGRQFRVA